MACFHDCLGSIGLLCRDCTEGGEQGGVDHPSVLEESTDNLLNAFDLVWREGGGFVFFHSLHLCAIVNGCCFIRGVLWYSWLGVLIFRECSVDVSRHVHGDVPVDVMPLNSEPFQSTATL